MEESRTTRTRSPSPNRDREQQRFAVNKVIETSLKALWRIWEEMGIEEKQKKSRADTALEHVKNLMGDMVKEEGLLLKKFEKTIEEFSEKLRRLCEELSYPHVELADGLTLVQREKVLRAKVETMTQEKKGRMQKYEDLHSKDKLLCETLSATPFYLPSNSVPTSEQLKEFERHISSLQVEKDKRFAEFVRLKEKVNKLYMSIETDPETSFGRDLICEEDDTFTLSPMNMDMLRSLHDDLVKQEQDIKQEVSDLWYQLRALWDRLETPDIDREEFELHKDGHGKKLIRSLQDEIEACEKLKFQNMQKFVVHIRNELVSWWDKCYYSTQQRKAFHYFEEDNFTESLLEIHEKELKEVQDYYKEHKAILEKIDLREKFFKEMVVFDEKSSDPNRFFKDRGGKLLQEEKARKKLMKELPKVEEEVTEAVSKYEAEHQKHFLVNGLRFPEYTAKQWDDFHYNKEEQKQSRLKAKAKQTQDEMLFGSKTLLNTPSKRRGPNPATPQRTPLKARKNEISSSSSCTSNVDSPLPIKVKVKVNIPSKTIRSGTVAMSSSSRKRRSIRLMKRAATERKASSKSRRSRDSTFSCTTVSGGDDHGSTSLASTGTYNDFAVGLRHPNSRSSVVPSQLNLHKR